MKRILLTILLISGFCWAEPFTARLSDSLLCETYIKFDVSKVDKRQIEKLIADTEKQIEIEQSLFEKQSKENSSGIIFSDGLQGLYDTLFFLYQQLEQIEIMEQYGESEKNIKRIAKAGKICEVFGHSFVSTGVHKVLTCNPPIFVTEMRCKFCGKTADISECTSEQLLGQ